MRDALAEERRLTRDAERARRGAGRHDHGARPERVGAAHQEAAVRGRDRHDGVEHELGTGRLGLLVQQRTKFVAGDALRESGKILDPLSRADLTADARAIDHRDLQAVAPRHHGGGQSRHAGADDHDIDVLHDRS